MLCPGCSWREDGGGEEEENEEEEGWGGWVGEQDFKDLSSRMGCAFPLGKGPQDAWVGLVLGPGKGWAEGKR